VRQHKSPPAGGGDAHKPRRDRRALPPQARRLHPFPNGNGRWSRLAADLLALQLGQERFSWGRGSIVAASQTRQTHVRALKAADAGDVSPLLAFARTMRRLNRNLARQARCSGKSAKIYRGMTPWKRYPTPGSVTQSEGVSGSGSIFWRRWRMWTRSACTSAL